MEIGAFVNLAGMSFADLLTLFLCNIENDDDFYDVVACNMAKSNREYFEAFLPELSGDRLRAAICGFGLSGITIKNIENYLDYSDEKVISAAIDAMRRTNKKRYWSKIEPLLNHESPYVRGAVLRYTRQTLKKESLQLLLDALKDPDEIVRTNALDELEGIATPNLRLKIMPFLEDESPSVRAAALSLLNSL